MGEYAKSEQMLRHLMVKYKGDKRAESACHSRLTMIAHRMGRRDEAFEHESKCLLLQVDTVKSYEDSIIELAKAYNNLGLQYGSNGQFATALEHFFMSNKIKFAVFHDWNHLLMADTYGNIGNCYCEDGHLDIAEQNILRSIEIRKRHENQSHHPDFIHGYMTLGNIYGERKEYEKAIKQHTLALEIALDTLPYNHLLLGMCYSNLAGDYKNTGRYRLARENYEKALSICRKATDERHQEIQCLLANLEEVEKHL